MSAVNPAGSVGRELERTRLQQRARRTATVMSMLQHRRDERRDRGVPVPAPLNDAIGGFEAELHALDARLAALGSASDRVGAGDYGRAPWSAADARAARRA